MPARYFSRADANALLPVIRPLLTTLMNLRAEVAQTAFQNQPILSDTLSNIATPDTTAMMLSFSQIETLTAQIEAYGCQIENGNVGLVDFLANQNGRDVFLCWKVDEPLITHYHEIHEGFNDRKPIYPMNLL